MPHCIIEYSKNILTIIEAPKLVGLVHEAAIASELFEPEDIKSRAIVYEDYGVRADKKAFIHVTMKILSGRNDEQKSALSALILAAFEPLKLNSTIISVEIAELHRESYARIVL